MSRWVFGGDSENDFQRKSREGSALFEKPFNQFLFGEFFFFLKVEVPHGAKVTLARRQWLFMLEGLFVRNGEFLASFLPARGQYPAAIGSCHPLTESMLVLSFPAGRLVRTFHGRYK